jgi:hypothetical protein
VYLLVSVSSSSALVRSIWPDRAFIHLKRFPYYFALFFLFLVDDVAAAGLGRPCSVSIVGDDAPPPLPRCRWRLLLLLLLLPLLRLLLRLPPLLLLLPL